MKSPRKPIESLVSLRTNAGVTLHAYTIGKKEADERICNQLCAHADRLSLPYLPVILQTRLTTGGGIVRKILVNQSPQQAESIQKVIDGSENHYFAIFILPTGCNDDIELMELH